MASARTYAGPLCMSATNLSVRRERSSSRLLLRPRLAARRRCTNAPVTLFCLLHGKWHEPSCWEPLVRELERRGHECVTPEVPFHDPAAGHERRAAPAMAALEAAGASGSRAPIAVVGHSLATAVAAIVARQRS